MNKPIKQRKNKTYKNLKIRERIKHERNTNK